MRPYEFLVPDPEVGARRVPFPGPQFIIGSGDNCALRFESNLVWARHAEFTTDDEGHWWVKDLTGAGLLWINGQPTPKGPLSSGTFVRLGRLELEVRSADEADGGAKSGPSGTMTAPTPMRPLSALEPIHVPASPTPAAPPTPAPGEPQPFRRHRAGSGSVVPGAVIDNRYRIISRIAAGGMGEVYKAEHTELGKMFALKVMLGSLSNDQEFVTRFKREAVAAGRIGQQNIVDISDFGRTADDRFYFVMEFLDGMTLSSLVHRKGAQPIDRVINICLQVARALASAHALGIIHRDLKPENVMLLQKPGQSDFVKVLDFGVAKVTTGQNDGSQTAVGMVVGTPRYMAPEQVKAMPVDARSDIYALGLIVYELITGRPTFSGETPSLLMVKQVTEAPPPLEPGPLGSVPPDLEALVFAMLEKDPARRPQSMTEVIDALDLLSAQVKTGIATPRPITGLGRVSGAFSTPGQPSGVKSGPSITGPGVPPPAPPATGMAPGPSASQVAPAPSGVMVAPRSKVPFIVLGLVAVGALAGVGYVVTRPSATTTTVIVAPPPPTTQGGETPPKPGEPVKAAGGETVKGGEPER
ncbi:MAG: protein kinase, partial [Myxococcaceae bacterium]|nr:protein kinase [Myxococcaceae bacterium]